VEIAGLHYPQPLERLRQIRKSKLLMHNFHPFVMFTFRTYRPFGAEPECAERQAS
jgi:hypothetical protein